MFEIMNENTGHPIKVWLNDMAGLEDKCLEQAYHLSQLPFVHKWVCLMPDTHAGKGMPLLCPIFACNGMGGMGGTDTTNITVKLYRYNIELKSGIC